MMEKLEKYGFVIIVTFVISAFYEPVFCFLILGVLLVFMAIKSLLDINQINKKGIRIIGKIARFERDEDSHQIPIIEFETIDGEFIKRKPYFYVSSDASIFMNNKDAVNQNIEIIYNPKNPEMFLIENDKEDNNGGIVLIIIVGLVFIGIALAQIFGYINAIKW